MKKIFIFIIILVVVCSIFYMVMGSKLLKKENVQVQNGKTEKQTKQGSNVETMKLKEVPSSGCGNENGYYYIGTNNNKKDTNGNDYYSIRYFDYTKRQEIYLCNKPNCKHNVDTCNAYLTTLGKHDLFLTGEFLYLSYSPPTNSNFFGIGEEVEIKEEAPTIFKINLDGTNRTKLMELPSGMEISDSFIVSDTSYAYAVISKSERKQMNKNEVQMLVKEKKLLQINLEKGTYQEVYSLLNKDIIGVYQNKIILYEIIPSTPFENFSNNEHQAYLNALNKSNVKVISYNLATKEERIVLEDIYQNLPRPYLYENTVYYMTGQGGRICYASIETFEKGVFMDQVSNNKTLSIFDIYDGKIMFTTQEDKYQNPEFEQAFYVDIKTKTKKEFTLLIKEPKFFVEIKESTKDFYFVVSGHRTETEYIAHFDVNQTNILETYYSLISKEDYWNCKPNYITMTNTKDKE